MIKKIIPIFLCVCLSFAVICYGENTVETPKMQTPPTGQMPQMGEMPPMGEMPSRGQMPQMGVKPDDGKTPQMPAEVTEPEQSADQKTEDTKTPETTTGDTPIENQPSDEGQRGQGRIPSFGQTQQQNPAEKQSLFEKYFDAVASVILLILAYLFVILYKRRQY